MIVQSSIFLHTHVLQWGLSLRPEGHINKLLQQQGSLMTCYIVNWWGGGGGVLIFNEVIRAP